jgi:protein-disulfide isomerase
MRSALFALTALALIAPAACLAEKSQPAIETVQLPPDRAEIEAMMREILANDPSLVSNAGLDAAAREYFVKNPQAAGKAQTEAVVKAYLLDNPEVLIESLNVYERRQAEARQAELTRLVQTSQSALYNTKSDPSIGPANAPVTVVEFFDYRCGYCKQSTDWVFDLPAEYKNKVRVVFKELPIFGGISETASLAALAAAKQGKYEAMHRGLMGIENNDDLTDANIDAVAKAAGVNVQKMRADMNSAAVQKQLADSQALGASLQVGGTPGFFIGDQHIEGANTRAVEAAIAARLKG